MANIRNDENFVYIDLWGETLEYDRIQYALYQLNSAFELRIIEDTDSIINYRLNGVPYKISVVNGKEANDICPYSWESFEYVRKTINDAGLFANSILAQYGVELNPNWREINKKWLSEVERLEQTFGDAIGKATQAALEKQAYKYQQAYDEELSKDFGLNFGVISSSLTAHLLYAAQATAKERKDHARAERVATEAMQNSHVDITAQIFASIYPLYVDSLEPAMQKLLSQYYAYIITIFSRELHCPYDDVVETYSSKKSNDFIAEHSLDAKTNIMHALNVDPNNGNVIGYAIKNGVLDTELCEYGKNASKNFQIILKKWAISVLRDIYTAGRLFNKPIITDENKDLIAELVVYYNFIDNNILNSNDWQEIINEVFGEELESVRNKFEVFKKCKQSKTEIVTYAQKNQKLNIVDDLIKKFIVACNELNDGWCLNFALAMNLDIKQPITIQDVHQCIAKFNQDVDAEKEVLKKKEEQRKQAEEQKKAEEEQRKTEHEKQEKIRKEIIKKKVIKFSAIIASVIVIIVLFNIFAMPPIYYGLAHNKIQESSYGDAAILYSKAENYKDAKELCALAWENVNNKALASGSGTFGIALKNNGKVVAAGSNEYGQCNVSTWSNIVSVAAGGYHAVGLKEDGTVVAIGENSDGECDVSSWTDIVAIATGDNYTLGLKKDGTVMATGLNDWGQCNVSTWRNIIAIAAGEYHAVGLKKDGTVVSTSIDSTQYSFYAPYYYNQDNLSSWKNIIAISAGRFHVVGLREDGTVISTRIVNGKWRDCGQYDVNGWTNIVSIAAGDDFTIGIKSDGTSIIAGNITSPDSLGTMKQKYWDENSWNNLKQP